MSAEARTRFLLTEAGLRGCDAASLPTRLGLSGEELVAIQPSARVLGDRLYAPSALDAASVRLREWVGAWHVAQPSALGAPLSEAGRAAMVPEALVRPLLAADPLVTVDGATVRQSGFVARRDLVRDSAAAALVSALQRAGLEMPSIKELIPAHGTAVEPLLRSLLRDQEVVLVGHDRWSTPSVVQALAARLVQELTPLRDYTASELRAVFGVSRKYLIPWLEFCDREGLTLRHGDMRRLGARAQRVAQGLS
jgi:selenocysteine-specific elongation factor